MAASSSSEYIDIGELSARTGLSKSTIHRLKKAGRIPFFQPAGTGGRIVFPPDALERSQEMARSKSRLTQEQTSRLSGPLPTWMRDSNQHE